MSVSGVWSQEQEFHRKDVCHRLHWSINFSEETLSKQAMLLITYILIKSCFGSEI